MKTPPKAGERKMLPRIAMYGFQIFSPSGGVVAGIDDPGPGVVAGSGGGPTARGAAGAAAAIDGSGGGFTCRTSAGFASTAGADDSAGAGASALASEMAAGTGALGAAAGAASATGNEARNSPSGFHNALAWSQARSFSLRLLSAIFSRMMDSEKRPAYSPFR